MKTREIHLTPRPTALEPFKVLITFMCVLAGVPLALHGAGPETVEDALPDWIVLLWGLELAIGGILTLLGTFTGLWVVERNGLAFLGASAAAYGLILLATAWPAAILSASLILGFSAACWVSIWLARRIPVIVRNNRGRSNDGEVP